MQESLLKVTKPADRNVTVYYTTTGSATSSTRDTHTPSWSVSNAMWTDEKIPLKHVAFLSVLPYPVTWYRSVYMQMKNLVEISSQLV